MTPKDLWQTRYQILSIILLSKLVKLKLKKGHNNKKCEMCGIKYKDQEYRFKYINVKDSLILCKYLCCKRSYQNGLMKA